MTSGAEILKLENVCKSFKVASRRGAAPTTVKALDNVSFGVFEGETLAIVGESGSGKTTTGRIIAGLEKADSGTIVLPQSIARSRRRGAVQLVFQDPFASFDPYYSIGKSIEEPLAVQGGLTKAERKEKALQVVEAVGLSSSVLKKRPHALSGGQLQRMSIARALIAQPTLVVLDEPVSALDVSVQAQVLNLLKDLQDQFGTTFLFISHDMAVVRFMADRVLVMKDGRVVEQSDAESLFSNPQHDYTRLLLKAVPASPF